MEYWDSILMGIFLVCCGVGISVLGIINYFYAIKPDLFMMILLILWGMAFGAMGAACIMRTKNQIREDKKEEDDNGQEKRRDNI